VRVENFRKPRRTAARAWMPPKPTPEPRRIQTLAWGLALALAIPATLLQWVYVFRGELYRGYPALRPTLSAACAQIGCVIGPGRQAQFLSIEWSDLQPDPVHPEWLALGATLKNRAGFSQAYPHLELTLTDHRDQPLARRVFAPDNYIPDAAARTTGLTANAEQSLRLLIDAGSIGASGYRLHVFYP
jgi:hypothetical protein